MSRRIFKRGSERSYVKSSQRRGEPLRRSQAIRFILAEHEIEHYFRDAWAIGAELGTEEEHKDEIAQRVLGAR